MEDLSKVKRYNLYAEYEGKKEVFLGGTYDDVYYIQSLYDPKGIVEIKVRTDGVDGKEGSEVEIKRNFLNESKNILGNERDRYIDFNFGNSSG